MRVKVIIIARARSIDRAGSTVSRGFASSAFRRDVSRMASATVAGAIYAPNKSRRNLRGDIDNTCIRDLIYYTRVCLREFIGRKCELAINLLGAVISTHQQLKKSGMMLQHSSYISLWHLALHLAIIVTTREVASLISVARFFLLPFSPNDTNIINGDCGGDLYYSAD